ncbi:MAG: SPFH domain-containing protein [Gordonia sp. (in: high G+C Gram-positive bacteria)]|uniref:SPFH domain-containing protein n=1 Tax=Gordonia sp. (in: high G+C Gram-positive bacteria) TaxID=84139 RepID=UPI0039E45DEA
MLKKAFRVNGFIALAVIVLLILGLGALALKAFISFSSSGGAGTLIAAIVATLAAAAACLLLTGLTVVDPNEARVVQFFGRYVGSVSDPGFHFVLPLSVRRPITLRVRNFETQRLKVNDADGNPVEIAAVVVYRVVDSYQAAFAVDDYEEYVETQSEAAVRHLATTHPYDAHDAGRTSLRDGALVAEELTEELAERTGLAGVEVIEARITHLAYAPEIAQAMLVRQQAAQVVAARQRIVEGAVGMVGLALDDLSKQGIIELDGERRATMVSNLLTVLCADRATQPVLNVGSLYS